MRPFAGDGLRGEDKSYDEAIQTEGLSEDENQNHSDEELGLLTIGTNTGITHGPSAATSTPIAPM